MRRLPSTNNQAGFTLIELVVVIVILGILAATALPKFVSIQSDAQLAAIQGVAGAISSASAVNYGVYLANTAKGVAISNTSGAISTALNAILAGGMPAGYSVTGATSVACGTGQSGGSSMALTISNSTFATGSGSATATLICTG